MAKLFQRSDLPADAIVADDIGLRPERPFQILGMIETLAFGDLLTNLVFYSTLANQFDHARLHIRYRNVRPYSADVISLSPWIDLAEPVRERWPDWLPSWGNWRRRVTDFGTQKGRNVPLYDMVVTSHMAQREVTYALPNPVPLRVPADRLDQLIGRLKTLGLDPGGWFAVIHYRDGSYRFRQHEGGHRDVDQAPFEAVADEIIGRGGQVIRLGHVGMRPFRPRPGFIDLVAEPTLVQCAAASFARFLLIAPSGVFGLALGFQVPTTIVDAVDNIGLWGPVDVLTHIVKTPDGTLRNEALRQSGLLHGRKLANLIKTNPAYQIRKASADDLRLVARKLIARTEDCPKWRAPAPVPAGPKPNRITWPLRALHPPIKWLDIE